MSTSAEESVSRIYTINFGKALLTPRYRRTDRVVNMIREFARKHMKTDEVKLDQELNRHVWKKGKANPPRRLRVRMMKDEDGIVIVSPYEEATKKSERTATATDEVIDNGSKPEKEEPIPETESEEPKEQPKTPEKEPKKTKRKKGSEAKAKKGK